MMYRKSEICVVCSISSDGKNSPVCITGIDSRNRLHTGPAGEWSSVMGSRESIAGFYMNTASNK